MQDFAIVSGTAALLITGAASYYFYTAITFADGITIKLSDPEQCLKIMRGEAITLERGWLPTRRLVLNQLSPLKSRSKDHLPWKLFFGIHNSLTTSDEAESLVLKKSVQEMLRLDDVAWEGFAGQVSSIDPELEENVSIALVPLVQIVTFKELLLCPLFGTDLAQGASKDAIEKLLDEINSQTMRMHRSQASYADPGEEHEQKRRSKQRRRSFVSGIWRYLFPKAEILGFEDNQSLRNALQIAFPTWNADDPKENPLNLLLAGFSTLWPIVLFCFLELKHRQHPRAQSWAKAIHEFAADPTSEQLNAIDPYYGISARMVIDEAFRLYSPIRMLPRLFIDTASGQRFNLVADIEAFQRDSEIWGEDALYFRPERWKDPKLADTAFKNDHLLCFGTKPLLCPAQGPRAANDRSWVGFATKMICVLVDALITKTDGRELDGVVRDNGRLLVVDKIVHDLKLIAGKKRE